MKRALFAAIAIALLLSMPTGALAGKQDKYTDLAALQPPPNPAVNWDCWVNGANIICDAQVLDTWESVEIDDLCDFSFYSIDGSESRKIRRVHDLDGRQLWSRNIRDLRETLVLNPDGSGPRLRAFGHFVEEFHFGTPGDVSTRTQTFKGTDVTIVGEGVGLVLHMNGLVTYDIDDNVLVSRGPHPILDDPDEAFGRICTAFEELAR
jgi:hypothetical protein